MKGRTACIRSSPTPDSPDILSIEEKSPPPAAIISDIALGRGSKRTREPSLAEPSVKRPKPSATAREVIDLSEDELQVGSRGEKVGGPSGRRKTNFSGLQPRIQSRIPSKGDIRPTDFGSSRSPKSSQVDKHQPIFLKEAVGGRNIWASTSNQRASLFPVFEPDKSIKSLEVKIEILEDGKNWEVVTDHDALQWMRLPVSKIREGSHSTRGKVVWISRSIYPGATPQVFYIFSTPDDARRFVQYLPQKAVDLVHDTYVLTSDLLAKMKQLTHRSSKFDKMLAQAQTKAAVSAAWNSKEVNGTSVESNSKPHRPALESVSATSTGSPTKPLVRPEKIKDRMLRAADKEPAARLSPSADTTHVQPTSETHSSPNLGPGRQTRRMRRSSPVPLNLPELPESWTSQNPEWQTKWQKSLVYPATGKNRATVDAEDIPRLDEGEFLNDNIISFYVRYLQAQLERTRPEVLDKVYIFSSFFFEKLKTNKAKYEGVRSWTARVDLFSYDYIVVPVNENYHWYLVIICNAPRLLAQPSDTTEQAKADGSFEVGEIHPAAPKMPVVEKGVKAISISEEPRSSPPHDAHNGEANQTSTRHASKATYGASSKSKSRKSSGGSVQKFDAQEPKIVTLDSLAGSHSLTCRVLKEYLVEEARDKKGIKLEHPPSGMTGKNIPVQDNFCDCGVFVLGYMKEFLKDPDEACRRLLQKECLEWDIQPSDMRGEIRDLLFALQEEQRARLEHERLEKKRARANKLKAAKSSSSTEPTTSMPGEFPSEMPLPASPQSSVANKQPSASGTSTNQASRDVSPHTTPAPVSGLQTSGEAKGLADPEPRFVEPLKDTGDSISNDDQNGDTFYSAATSPAHDQPDSKDHRLAARPFVEQISSSDSDDRVKSKAEKRKKKKKTKRIKSVETTESITPIDGQGTSLKADLPAAHRPKAAPTTSSYFRTKDTD